MNGSEKTDSEQYPGLERWRGAVDEKLTTIAGAVGDLKKDFKENVSEVKQSIESLGTRITETIREVDRCGKTEHATFETRISALEKGSSYVKGKMVVFAGLAGIVGGGLSSAAWGALFHKIFG
jgi:Sec-independent protein translocase protein TatA